MEILPISHILPVQEMTFIISLDTLAEEGLLKKSPMLFLEKCKKVDYERVRQYREPYLRAAFMAFVEQKGYEKPEYKEFAAQSWDL